MDEGSDFLEYLEIQGNLDMLTKSELLEHVRSHGGSISDRQLTSYISEGLVPKSARIGSRSGAHPRIVGELVVWIVFSRRRGLSVEAIKELLPLWKYLQRAVREYQEINLAEFEYLARQHVKLEEAVYAVPTLFPSTLPCPNCDTDDLSNIKFILKDNSVHTHCEGGFPLSLGFVFGDYDSEAECVRGFSATRLVIPMADEEDQPSTVILGVPNGKALPAHVDEREEDVDGPARDEVVERAGSNSNRRR